MKRITMLFLLILICCGAWSPVGQAADEEREQGETIRIGYIDYGAFIERSPAGEYTGFGVEYLNKIAEHTGWHYEYVYDTWENCLRKLRDHEIDFLGTAQKTPEREREYAFAKLPLGLEQTVLYTRIGNNDIFYNDYQAFNGKSIVLLRDSYQTEFFDQYAAKHGFSCQTYLADTDDAMVGMLVSGKVDLMIGGTLAMHTNLKVVGKEGAEPFYFMTYKGNERKLALLDEAQEKIQDENIYYANDLMKIYYGHSVIASQPQFTREDAEYIANSPDIRICIDTNDNYPMTRWQTGAEQPEGIAIDIMNVLATDVGLKLTYIKVPAGLTPAECLSKGIADAALPALTVDSSFYQDALAVSDPFLKTDMVPIMAANKEFDPLKIYKVALEEHFPRNELQVKEQLWNYTPLYCNSVSDCLAAVRDGEADVFFANNYVAAYWLKSTFFANVQRIYGYTLPANYGLITFKNNTALLSVINKAIFVMPPNRVQEIVGRHTLENRYQDTLSEQFYRNRVAYTIVALLLIVIFGGFIYFVHYQRRTIEKMDVTNQQLRKATRAKADFFARMSHDMRTPINGILGMANLSEGEHDAKKLRYNMSMVKDSSLYLLSLINDTLDMQRIEDGRMQLVPQVIKIKTLFDSLFNMLYTTAHQKGVELQIDMGNVKIDGYIKEDPVRLKQIAVNIVSNAIKFTPQGGTVFISMNTESVTGNVRHDKFVVRDTGVGMSKEFVETKLFKPYAQERNSMTTEYAGSGLGLSITRNLLEQMGGSITVESKQGEGTTVIVYLPIEEVEAEEVPSAHNCGHEDTNILQGKTILVCEDNALNAEIAKRLLNKVGCQVVWADNGAKGVEAFMTSAEGGFDAIIMDIRMPVLTGLEAAKRIRSLPRGDARTVPIVAMTANASREDVQQSKQAGMNAHLAKPIDVEKFYEVLEECLTNKASDKG